MRNIALTTLIILGGVFGLQNIQEVPVTFLIWQTSTYLAIALLAALLLGVFIGILTVLPWAMRQRRKARDVVQAMSLSASAPAQRTGGRTQPGTGSGADRKAVDRTAGAALADD